MNDQSQMTPARRPSWRGILAGLLMGLVVWFAMFSLALILSAFLSLDLQGASITAGIYAIVTALLSAYTAGYFAVKASAPEALFGDGVEILPKDATLTGMLTAASIIVLTTWLAISGLTGAVKTAGNVAGATASAVGSAAGAVGNAAGSVIGTTASIATTGATAAAASGQSDDIGNGLQALYKKVTGDISRDDIESWIAKNNDTLSKAQISASANVIENMVNKTKTQMADMDFSDIDTWKNLDEYAKNRFAQIETVIKGPELIQRLENEGLSEAQAQQVQQEALTTYQDYRAKTEQSIADAKAQVEQTKVKAQQAVDEAKETARKTALYTGLFGLLSMLFTFLASIAGAKQAAAKYRLERPLVISRTTTTTDSTHLS